MGHSAMTQFIIIIDSHTNTQEKGERIFKQSHTHTHVHTQIQTPSLPQADPSSGNHRGTPRLLLQGDQGGTDCTLVQTTAEWALLGHSGRGLRQWAPEEGSEGGPADTGAAS